MASKKTQIKLYKIDTNLFGGKAASVIPSEIIKYANEGVTGAKKRFSQQSLKEGIEVPAGFTFEVYHALKEGRPGWAEAWSSVLDDSAAMLSDKNSMSSFIAFIVSGNNVYALTGGLGNLTISRYVENFFGLDVVDRLLKSTQDRGISEASKSGVTGNVKSELRTFYDLTDGFSQDSFETFFKHLKSKIDIEIVKEYFEPFYPKKNYTSFFQGDNSFLIRKSLALSDVFELVKAVERIFDERESSGHNKLIPIGSVNSTKSDKVKMLNDALVSDLFNNQEHPEALDNYYFVPKAVPDYKIDGSDFGVAERANNVSDTYPDIPKVSQYVEVLLNVGGVRRTFANVRDFKDAFNTYKLFWKYAEDDRYNPEDALASINGVMENGGKSYLRFEGSWYEMRDNFKEIINKEFTSLVGNATKVTAMPPYLTAWARGASEDGYNFGYLPNHDVMVSHRVFKQDDAVSHMDKHIEYADLIHLDAVEPKLIHVKSKCNGEMRVAAAQVTMCAQKLNQPEREAFFREYHGRILAKAATSSQGGKISEDDFVQRGLSDSLKVCLVLSDSRVLADDPSLSLCGKFYFVKMFKDMDDLGFGDRFFVANV